MKLTVRKPDDWHLHVRDGAMLEAVLDFPVKPVKPGNDRECQDTEEG
jgi:dihydroorotase